MFVWMVLAAFIVMLASFNLSPRADLNQQQQVPLAEAAVTKFLVQHDAAIRYTESVLRKYHNGESETSVTPGQLHGCGDSDEGEMCPFLPIGFKYKENQYYSYLYCLNRFSAEEDDDTTIEGSSLEDCDTGIVYVITYGRVPERWKNVSTHRILGEYYRALHSKVAVGSQCGIVVPKTNGDERNVLNSDYVINGIDIQNNSIPPYFLNDSSTNFNDICTNNIGGEFPCVIYVTAI